MNTFRQTLEALGAFIRTPHGLLRALASAGDDPVDALSMLESEELGAETLAALAASLPRFLTATVPRARPSDPVDAKAWDHWVGLARRAVDVLEALPSPVPDWVPPLQVALETLVAERLRAAGEERPLDMNAHLLGEWAYGTLGAADDERVRDRVASEESARQAYRQWLASELEVLDLDLLPAAFEVACEPATTRLRLPHLGPEAYLEVTPSGSGITWRWPGQEPVLTSLDQAVVDLRGDAVSGALRSVVRLHSVAESEAAERVVSVFRNATAGVSEEVGLRAVEVLASNAWRNHLLGLASDFRDGEEVEHPKWASLALELRLAIEEASARLLSPRLFEAIEALDQRLEDISDAMLLIDDDEWARLTAGKVLPANGWWGRRAALEMRLPDHTLNDILAQVPGRRSLFERFWELVGRFLEPLPCQQRALAAARSPDGPAGEGRAPVVVVVHGEQRARIFELRITFAGEEGDPWAGSPQLRLGAREAVRSAFWAVAELTKNRLPLRSFEAHRIELIPQDANLSIDGSSLGLSAGLAFASLWTGLSMGSDLVASARADLGPVGGIREKLDLLGRLGEADDPVRVLVAAKQEVPQPSEGVRLVRVESWKDALRETCLLDRLVELEPEPERTPPYLVERKLRECVTQVKDQALRDEDGWLTIADRIRILLPELRRQNAADPQLVGEAPAWRVLALNYGNDHGRAFSEARELDPENAPSGAPRLFLLIVRLTTHINRKEWARGEEIEEGLVRALAEVDQASHQRLGGMALGTRGRFWMHREEGRNLEAAEGLLRQAVEHHVQHVPVEVPRSRTYLAMALRMVGRGAEALKEMDRARREIEENLKDHPYGVTTRIFVAYERARAHLALNQAELAVEAATEAIACMRGCGWTNLPGPFRTLAWALARLGDEPGRQAAIAELERLVAVSQDLKGFLEEAMDPAQVEREVF